VTRIIAGAARGRRLVVPATGTRPTADRVREALFSSLNAVMDLSGVRVLDLFAGSGALGFEALSRGAHVVTLVDSSPAAVQVMRRNVATVGLPGVHVVKSTATGHLRGQPQPVDLVLLDPPYDLAADQIEEILTQLCTGWLVQGAVVVVERGARDEPPRWPAGFGTAWNRRFGDTELHRAVWYGHGDTLDDLHDSPEPQGADGA
jgi:16S rRNA (guanine966-N2)-methyltransferase